MTNEFLIKKFLNKNCSIHLEDKPVLIHRIRNNEESNVTNYLNFLTKVFPENIFDTEKHFFNWFDTAVATMEEDLVVYYNAYTIKKGIDVLVNDAVKFFKIEKPHISEKYIATKFSNMYIRDIIVPELDIFMKKYPNDTSLQLMKRVTKKFKDFNEITATHIKDKVLNYYKKMIIPNKIKLYLTTMDLTLGSKHLIMDMNIRFKHDKVYFSGDMMDAFKTYYRDTYLNPKLMAFLDTKFQSEVKNVSELKVEYGDFEIENEQEAEHCTNIINTWYLTNKLKPKLDDLFSQLVITMGSRNWVVTWIGHGPMTNEKLLKAISTDESNEEYIVGKYEEWYAEAVINASERLISNNDFGFMMNL